MASTDLRWRLLFILCTILLAAAAVVMVVTSQRLNNSVHQNKQISCFNFHEAHPTFTQAKGCR